MRHLYVLALGWLIGRTFPVGTVIHVRSSRRTDRQGVSRPSYQVYVHERGDSVERERRFRDAKEVVVAGLRG
jgi:hypothetical protein